ncbi:sodium/calcium exchanger protein, putative [Cryptosporidium muris RN66]|uniref:Sodium/calcium exchanger protein, putative n=1 Tax=Cryptosporidium muris (strain RN66) TaxID=441375 RepID=B6AIS5_CRYMR|nr:sodium/calcium exchanger protein, putative [Cryptosporidium muris RN66]EEA08116.1 sodium/calcium exchanger protein, putative [Cryptosporidium muris RN66]|eukprot:XP_002142465.1 sodium/calcium exchanger protein [Cryptosporidium muris RN66]
MKFLVFFILLILTQTTISLSHQDEDESYSSYISGASEESSVDSLGRDLFDWSKDYLDSTTLLPYMKWYYRYIFEDIYPEEEKSSKLVFITGVLINKVTFSIILLFWICILFIACGTVADTYISSLMIKLAECMRLSDTFAGSTLLAFSNSASDVILGILSATLSERDTIYVFLGDVVGACSFITLVVFGCVMVFSKTKNESNIIYIPVYSHLRDSIALTIGLIQLLIINHLGYISSYSTVIPLLAYGFYVCLIQWTERSNHPQVGHLTSKDNFVGGIISQSGLLDTHHKNLSTNSESLTPESGYILNIPSSSLNDIPPIKLSLIGNGLSNSDNGLFGDDTAFEDRAWERIGSKSRSIKRTLLLLTPSHSPNPSFVESHLYDASSCSETEDLVTNDISNTDRLFDEYYNQSTNENNKFLTRSTSKPFEKATNILELPNNQNASRSKSPVPSLCKSSISIGTHSSSLTVGRTSQSHLVILGDDFAMRVSRNIPMSEVVYQTGSLHNSLLPPPATEENILKVPRNKKNIYRSNVAEMQEIRNFLKYLTCDLIVSLNIDAFLSRLLEAGDFLRRLLMTPIMFILYLTVPSPSVRRSVQIMQPIFIVLAIGLEKRFYWIAPFHYLLILLGASIVSLVLFTIYIYVDPTSTNIDESSVNCSIASNHSGFHLSSSSREFICKVLMYFDMFIGIAMAIYWNGVLVNELVGCIKVLGFTLGIKPAILGLTIVAMGNSIADLFANVAVARAGHARMGLAGCYGACVFLLLFGIGSSVFLRAIKLKFSQNIHLYFEKQIITATSQLLYFLPISALVVVLSKGRVHKIWGVFCIIYFAIGMAFILQSNY